MLLGQLSIISVAQALLLTGSVGAIPREIIRRAIDSGARKLISSVEVT